MQYPVPQFTDVEDKIIGPLTLKQFMILFGCGIVIFLAYSSTKSILVVAFVFMLFGVPSLVVAFGKANGRPIYTSFGYFVKFFTSPKVLIFHKEASVHRGMGKVNNAQLTSPEEAQKAPVQTKANTAQNLKDVQALLLKTQHQEEDVIKSK